MDDEDDDRTESLPPCACAQDNKEEEEWDLAVVDIPWFEVHLRFSDAFKVDELKT